MAPQAVQVLGSDCITKPLEINKSQRSGGIRADAKNCHKLWHVLLRSVKAPWRFVSGTASATTMPATAFMRIRRQFSDKRLIMMTTISHCRGTQQGCCAHQQCLPVVIAESAAAAAAAASRAAGSGSAGLLLSWQATKHYAGRPISFQDGLQSRPKIDRLQGKGPYGLSGFGCKRIWILVQIRTDGGQALSQHRLGLRLD
mmetsp:Transcript_43829/g.86928  ORF Transcript_43829/g.86928 Transcript_43829/m.86928 type:complete len:200 (+) Transcript_43829:452-1051(+)